MRRVLTVAASTVATVVLVLSFLFIPLSLVTGEYGHVVIEVLLALVSLAYVTRVMRADRRGRRAAGGLLPPGPRPARRGPPPPVPLPGRGTPVPVGRRCAPGLAFGA